ncbi:hypothetical protein BD311DRAFT_752453 [Dichomitus squalens]|uniref:Uncharacterized protein n=1 Tax=Dichomitus squalens TaxID=114155 RepID=A0A4Q9MUJ4_9APHY|nr:hypothetical protein BD311DRAFT_752453 [Dichomitus squalens]
MSANPKPQTTSNQFPELEELLESIYKSRVPGTPHSPAAPNSARVKTVQTSRREQRMKFAGLELVPNCAHKMWLQSHYGGVPCEICEATMPKHYFTCQKCRMDACGKCGPGIELGTLTGRRF